MGLPPEVLGLALSLLEKGDLKQARLVSKAWEKAAVPYLFDEVFMSPNPVDLSTAEAMIDQFGYHIRTLIFSAVYYKEICWTRSKLENARQTLGNHLGYAYNNYCRVRKDQMELLEGGTCLAHLCRALRRLPNLCNLVLTDLGSDRFLPTNNRYYDGIAKSLEPCTLEGCQLSLRDHHALLFHPQSGFQNAVANPWDLAMLAWWAVGSPVRELLVESSTGLPLRSFVNTVQRPCEMDLLFRGLTTLQLDLHVEPGEPSIGDSMDDCSFREGSVSQALSTMKSLQCLYISAKFGSNLEKYKPMTLFQTILGTCQFPKLRLLVLSSIKSTMEELLSFLGSSKQLQRLTLYQHGLLSGTWEKAVDWMRSSLTLEVVEIDRICGGWEPDSPMIHRGPYRDCFGHVQDFFLRHGPNPFSKETLAARKKDLGIEIDFIRWPGDMSPAAEERYQR